MASTGQALAHSPQRMQSSFCDHHAPALSLGVRTVGQAAAQGAGSQARQIRASNPVDSPPEDPMRMPAVSQESRLWTIRRRQGSRNGSRCTAP